MLTLHAYAKINLTLEILGKRSDGYHEIATVFQEIDLKDTLSFGEDRELKVEGDDLALEAARLLQQEAGLSKGASISIKKNIPRAAGLGGSSSDAAATLRALNELWGLGFPLPRLVEVASRVSADTAFFLCGGTALGQGRGEHITPLPPFPSSWLVLFRPPVNIPPSKTKSLYSFLNQSHFTRGQFTKSLVELLYKGREVPPSSLFNAFEKVAFTAFPGLEQYWQRFSALGADNIHLAGSGPALFTLVKDKAQGEKLYHALKREGLEAYLVRTIQACKT